MIKFIDLLSGNSISDIPIDHQQNLEHLLGKCKLLEEDWGKPLKVTSGYRTMQQHLNIYSRIASKKGQDFDPKNVPMKSRHLYGLACDLYDPTHELYKHYYNNQSKLTELGLWCEMGTDGWLHIQTVPYGSYKEGKDRFFLP